MTPIGAGRYLREDHTIAQTGLDVRASRHAQEWSQARSAMYPCYQTPRTEQAADAYLLLGVSAFRPAALKLEPNGGRWAPVHRRG